MVQHCNTVNKQTSVIFLHHTIKKLRKGFERKEYCRRKCQRERVQAENLLHVMRQEVHPGAGCVNKVARHAGLRYHRLRMQHKCQHLCSHRSGTAENFSSPGFCQGTLFFWYKVSKVKTVRACTKMFLTLETVQEWECSDFRRKSANSNACRLARTAKQWSNSWVSYVFYRRKSRQSLPALLWKGRINNKWYHL